MSDSSNHLSLRKVIKADEVLLYNWANDPDVRKWSFKNKSISLNEHKNWFENKLNDPNVLIWIFEKHHSPIGMVRLEKKDNEVLLNYLIASESRGKGLASEMLIMAMNELKNYWHNIYVIAYTLSRNIPSIKSLEKAGFFLENRGDKKNRFIYNKTERIGTSEK